MECHTHFLTSDTYQKRNLLQSARMGSLFADVLQHYRREQKMQVHDFVVMPNHVHVMLTTMETAETAMKRIKGCFSTRAIKELGFRQKIWQPGHFGKLVDSKGRFWAFRSYIRQNPVKAGLAPDEASWRFGSASGAFEIDAAPEWVTGW
jgi:putative transposase